MHHDNPYIPLVSLVPSVAKKGIDSIRASDIVPTRVLECVYGR